MNAFLLKEPCELYQLICRQCKKRISSCNVPDIVAFCDDCCYQSSKCEDETESKDEMLHSIMYADSRNGYVEHEIDFGKNGGE